MNIIASQAASVARRKMSAQGNSVRGAGVGEYDEGVDDALVRTSTSMNSTRPERPIRTPTRPHV